MTRSHSPRITLFRHLALAGVLGLSLVGLTQCRIGAERVTGINLNTPGTLSVRNSCARRCKAEFKAALQAEETRYRTERRECGHDLTCRKNVNREHLQRLLELIRRRVACKRGCYNEGSGNGGA